MNGGGVILPTTSSVSSGDHVIIDVMRIYPPGFDYLVDQFMSPLRKVMHSEN